MNLTKKDRNALYVDILEQLESEQEIFICDAVLAVLRITHNINFVEDYLIRQHFPELWAKKPPVLINHYGGLIWFPKEDLKSRIDIIKLCIQ